MRFFLIFGCLFFVLSCSNSGAPDYNDKTVKELATEVMFNVMRNDLFDEGATALILESNFPFPSKDYNEWKHIAETGKD